jgi:hypothetical protein
MTVIDFPATPTLGDKYAAGSHLWEYDGENWLLIPYGAPNLGVVDGGKPSGAGNVVFVNGGNPKSTFISDTIDCGGV